MNTQFKIAAALIAIVLPGILFADDTLYCPQKHGFISLGMTEAQVKAACGDPISIEQSKRPFLQKIPVQELIYHNVGTPKVVQGPYSLDIRYRGGSPLQINIVNNKVKSISVNNKSANAASFCEGGNIQIGDQAAKVYAVCGAPIIVNNTWVEEPVRTAGKPTIWIYQPGPNQSSVSLTFVDGKLQSIN